MGNHTCSSGLVEPLLTHPHWIVAYGLTDRQELVRRKLESMNTTSGDVAYVATPTRGEIRGRGLTEVLAYEELLPGYFLIGVTSDRPNWEDMQQVEEIFKVLTTTDDNHRQRPAILPRREIEHIVNLIMESPKNDYTHPFRKGHRVTVDEGSFEGLSGEVTELRGKTNVKVDVEIRDRIIAAVFPAKSLRRHGPPVPLLTIVPGGVEEVVSGA